MARTKVTGKRKAGKASTAITKKARTGVRVPRASIGIGFPEQLRTTLRYSESYDIGAATFGTTKQFVSANGIFDPNITGTGHQPLGFDQLMAVYNHYVVLGSTIKATFFGREDTNASQSSVVGIYADDSAANSYTAEGLIEGSGRNKWAVITASDQIATLYDKYKSSVVFSKVPMADSTQKGSVSANPSEVHAWCLWNFNQASTTESVYVTVDVEYDVVFFERTDLATS